MALILTYAMIPLGMIARPLGALLFGYIGDRYGRERALFYTLGGMSLISCCIAFSPPFALIFCLGRIAQNFLAAGEAMGGAIFLLENAPEKRHDLLSSLYNATTIGGILLASGGVAALHSFEEGWRFLYLAGSLTAFFGFMIRRKATVITTNPVPFRFSVLWSQRKALLWIALSAGFSYANYSISLVLMNGFIPLITSITKTEMMRINTFLLVLDFAALPLFGWIASKITREKLMLYSSLGVVACGIPLFLLLPYASLAGIIAIRICLVLFGVAFFAPFHAFAQQLVPPACRYAVVSIGYAIGTQLLGGPTSAISLWLFKQTGMVSAVCWYWVLLGFFSALAFSTKINQLVFERK